MEEENADIQETAVNIPAEKDAVDSYDELAKEAEVEPKRGRGRPKGAKNRPKPPPPPSESEEEQPPPKRKKAKAPVPLDVEFDDGPPPSPPKLRRTETSAPVRPAPRVKGLVRIKKPPAAGRSLLDVVAEAAHQHGARERDRRRSFYESFLPM